MGGKAMIDGIKAIRVTSTRNMVTPQGEMQAEQSTLVQYPLSIRQEMKLPMGTMTSVITPEAAFVVTPMGTQDLPSSQRDAAAADIRSDVIHILKNADDPKYVFSAGGTEKVGDVTGRILDISPGGGSVRWVVDPATGRILRSTRTTAGPQGGEIVTDYTEWTTFGPITMATSATQKRGGNPSGSFKITNVEVNPAVEADAFVKK